MTANQIHHYSGVLVITLPGQLGTFLSAVQDTDGITVTIRDPDQARAIVVLDAASRDHLAELNRYVAARPEVVLADPILHYIDEGPEDHGEDALPPPDPQEQSCSKP